MRHLSLGAWHGAIWMALALASSGVAVQLCLRYNITAGSDLTTGHIVWIAIAVLSGPMAGLVANFQAGETLQAATWAVALGGVVVPSLAPFILWKHSVTTGVFAMTWVGFIFAACLWFAGALVSLGFFLS